MKKLINIAAVLLAASMIFVGCSNGVAAPGSNNGGSGSGNEAGGSGNGETPSNELVIFDPAKYTGEKIQIDGETFAVFNVDGYNTTFDFNSVDCSGVSKFKAKLCAKVENNDFKLGVKIADKDNHDISSIELVGLVTKPKLCEAGFAKKESWNTLSETKLATRIQPMVQDSADNYKAQSDVVVYVGKITAE